MRIESSRKVPKTNRLSLGILDKNDEQKVMWEVEKQFQDLCSRGMKSCHPAVTKRAKLWSLNANLCLEEPHQLTKFA